MVKLHQILSMKFLDFSLNEIKNRLISFDTPDEVKHLKKEEADGFIRKVLHVHFENQGITILSMEV